MNAEFAGQPVRHRSHLPRRQRAVHPVAEVAEFARHGAARHSGRRNRHGAGHRRHAAASRHRRLQVDHHRAGARRGIGIPLGMVQMTAVPQRTALSHAFGALCVDAGRHRRVLSAHAARPAIHDGGAVDGSHPRLADLHRQPDGRRQAAGNSAAAARSLIKGRTSSTCRAGRVAVGWPCIWCSIPSDSMLFPADDGRSRWCSACCWSSPSAAPTCRR